ncbi:MATE efflux family protein [Paenibacillus vortex V453]|uniref:MATE efflux family protein n=1 Tax=Paenibacillus vortex V453 TaxID=715225 RepID=A0A2R9SQ87_9BACL|nr:MATE efflux family protein [Paenibacillus vortex V453]
MQPTTTTWEKLKQFAIILIPILVTQLSLSAITFFVHQYVRKVQFSRFGRRSDSYKHLDSSSDRP